MSIRLKALRQHIHTRLSFARRSSPSNTRIPPAESPASSATAYSTVDPPHLGAFPALQPSRDDVKLATIRTSRSPTSWGISTPIQARESLQRWISHEKNGRAQGGGYPEEIRSPLEEALRTVSATEHDSEQRDGQDYE